jgi:hypothetical protein
MNLTAQSPKKALKAFLKRKPLRSEIDLFKLNLTALLDKISVIENRPKDESEEHLKNDIRDFLRDTYCRDTDAIITKSSNFHGMQEVIGSAPIFSATHYQGFTRNCEAFFFSVNTKLTQKNSYN